MNVESISVKKAVLKVLINYYPKVKNHAVEKAHPKHKMSGLQRLRELRAKGVVQYEFDKQSNTYLIHTPIQKLRKSFFELAG